MNTSRRTRALATASASGRCLVCTSTTSNGGDVSAKAVPQPWRTGEAQGASHGRKAPDGHAFPVLGPMLRGTLRQDLDFGSALRETARQLIDATLQASRLGQEARRDERDPHDPSRR